MEIKFIKVLAIQAGSFSKILTRTVLLLSCTTIFGSSLNSLTSQSPKITINRDRITTIYEVFEIIGNQTDCTFIYQADIFKDLPTVELKKGTIQVHDLLKQFLPSKDFNINTTKDNLITITRRISQTFPQGSIKGVVTDSLGMGMSGVNITIKHTTRGTQSNFEGQYAIVASPSDTLVFSYIGFKSQEIVVGNRNIINVIMRADATSLDQVVINAGYYKVTEREKTGNISKITATDLEKQPVSNPLAALQGRIAGVDIVQTSGVSGGGFNVRIRGQNSIVAGSDPLYIIDGIPFDARSLADAGMSAEIIPRAQISPLNAINPDNIESIEILKDADATAIYGSRGANGVVLITTKKGKEGKTIFNIHSTTGLSNITRKMKLLNTEQYLKMRQEAFANDGITVYPDDAYDINGTWDPNRYTDWQKELIGRTAESKQLHASVSGGDEHTRFLLSGNYLNEASVFPGSFKYDRLNFHSSLTHRSKNDRFNIHVSTSYSLESNNLPKVDLAYEAIILPPNAPSLYDADGNINWENSTWNNPLAALQATYRNKTKTLLTNSVLSYRPFKEIEAKINLGYGKTHLDEIEVTPHSIYDPAWGLDSDFSSLSINTGDVEHYIAEPQIQTNHTFGDFKLNLLLGTTFQRNSNNKKTFWGSGFPDNLLIENLQAASSVTIADFIETVYSYHSIFARTNLAYRDKLFLNLTGRRDGSSRFGPGNKYGNFGALGLGWIFFEDQAVQWVNFAKIRGSYGITGNDQIGDYQYLSSYAVNTNTYDGNIGIAPARLYNPNFKWEQNKKAEIALELELIKNKLSLDLAYYYSLTSNQLINYVLPATTGFTSILTNLDAVVMNKGLELEMNGSIINSNDISWRMGANLTLPKNKLLEFPGLENSTYSNRFVIGESLNIVKLYKLTGMDPETGLYTFHDYNDDGNISSPDDKQYIADLSPSLYGGLTNSIRYKNWGIDFSFQAIKKNALNQFFHGLQPGSMFNQPIEVLDRWQNEGDNSFMQPFSAGMDFEKYLSFSKFSQSSAVVSDASFIRLKSAEISYTISPRQSDITSLRIALQGQNLLTFTKFKGGDPEQTIGFVPNLRKMAVNLQLQF